MTDEQIAEVERFTIGTASPTRGLVLELIAHVRQVRRDAQALYNELYSAYMDETAIERCDELREKYPQYEANRND